MRKAWGVSVSRTAFNIHLWYCLRESLGCNFFMENTQGSSVTRTGQRTEQHPFTEGHGRLNAWFWIFTEKSLRNSKEPSHPVYEMTLYRSVRNLKYGLIMKHESKCSQSPEEVYD